MGKPIPYSRAAKNFYIVPPQELVNMCATGSKDYPKTAIGVMTQ